MTDVTSTPSSVSTSFTVTSTPSLSNVTSTPSSPTVVSTFTSSIVVCTPSSFTFISTSSSSAFTSISSSSTMISTSSSTVTSTPSSATITSTPSLSTVTTSTTTPTSTATATVTAASTSASPASTPTSSMAQTTKVVFDDSYKQGGVYVLPPIQELKVNVFQETNVKTPLDPAMPCPTKTHAMQVDEAKLASGQDKLKGDQDEACVLKLLYKQLQKATHPGDTPVFLFCSLMLSNHEKDIVIFHRKYGVIIVEVKGVENPRSFDRLKKAAKQLLRARDAIRTELQGLLAPDAVTLLMALPNLTDAGNARQSMQILRDNPDIHLLCGRKEADYKTFLQQLPTRPDPLVWEAQPDSHQAFVTAVSSHLSVEVYSPTEIASELAQVHRSWLLTPDQAPVLHCYHRLLHLWGPPGAGKTLLLLHRVRLWLQDNKHVILCVGHHVHSILLQHLGRATVTGDGGRFSHKLTLCRSINDFRKTVEELQRQVSPADISVVVDEVEDRFLSRTLTAFQQGRIFCLWTASVQDIPDTESAMFLSLGGEKVLLPSCLRCPPHVVEVARKVLQATPHTPAMTSFPCLPATMPTASVKVCFHPSHPRYRPLSTVSPHFDCEECSRWLRSSVSPLSEGLPVHHLQWRLWVILYIWDVSDMKPNMQSKMVEWLRSQGMPAVSEIESDFATTTNLPVSEVQQSSRGQMSGIRDETAWWRERVVRGEDRHGNTAVHFVPHDIYMGMEKPCVLVLHWDLSHTSHRDDKGRRHRHAWFGAMTRCQAELCVWLVSPSPAASCLLSQEELEGWKRNEMLIQEEQQFKEILERIKEVRHRREGELAQQTREVQIRRERLDEQRRLSQEQMEWCRQEEQQIKEEEHQFRGEEQRIQKEQQHEELSRRDEELARRIQEAQERRRRLEAKQKLSQEGIEWCRQEEQRIHREEQQIMKEQQNQEGARQRNDEAVRLLQEALQQRDLARARLVRKELERQRRKQEKERRRTESCVIQ